MGLFKLVVLPVAIAIVALYAYNVAYPQHPPEIPSDGWYGEGKKRKDDEKIVPFEVKVDERTIADLQARLQSARISHEPLEDANTFEYGFNSHYLKQVKDHWLGKFSWPKQQALLNTWPQFTTEVEGVKVHFYHVKPDAKKYKKVLPLLIVHGWPGNVFEFYKIIPMLIDPAAHKIDSDVAFEVIAPSIPGYGFSGQPKKTGFGQVAAARVFRKLLNRLGHKKFYVQGGDWGAAVVSNLARIYPESVHAVHLNMAFATPFSTLKGSFYNLAGSLFPQFLFADKAHHHYNMFSSFADLLKESGYMHIQATKPDTVGTALNDSPLGLAAYILEKFSTWTNEKNRLKPDGGLTEKFTLDELLTIVTIYWVNGNIVSSQRFYKEFFLDPTNFQLGKQYLSVPTAHAQFGNEFFDRDPPEITATLFNLTSHVSLPDGGHFAAFEEPAKLARHLFSFVRSLGAPTR